MQYNPLGSTDLNVSALALGGNIFGRFTDRAQTTGLLALAEAHGVNLVDTSDTYSDGLSEVYIGEALRGRRDRWVIATKCGIRSDESPRGLGRRESVRRKLEASLSRLGTDCVDIYQMHHFDPETPFEETLGALDDCVREGKARCVGASNYSGEQMERVVATATCERRVMMVSVQCLYHLFRRDAEVALLPWCIKHRVAVFAYGALARGVLGGRYLPGLSMPAGSRAEVSASIRADLVPEVLDAVSRLKRYADERGTSIGCVALAWVLAQPGITSAIVGVRNSEQLLDNIQAIERPLSRDAVAEVEGVIGDLRGVPAALLGRFAPP